MIAAAQSAGWLDPKSVAVIIAAVFGPLITYLITVRRLSGKITYSTSQELWNQNTEIKKEYRDRLKEQDIRIRDLESRLAQVEKEKNDLVSQVNALQVENLILRQSREAK